MSVRHIGLVLDHLEAPPPVKLVALILADHADADGVCWPSYRRIAERSCLAERTVRRYVRELIDAGLVTKLRTGTLATIDGERIRVTNAYRISAAALELRPSLLSTESCGKVAVDGHLEVAVDGHPRWSRTATKPSLRTTSINRQQQLPVDNLDSTGDGTAALPGSGDQGGAPKRLSDVLSTMSMYTDRAGGDE